MENAIFASHDYLGPYFTPITKDTPETVKTHRLCLKGIDEADLVFCWFDDIEAYASLFEMGYAHAKGKFTAVAYPEGFDRREFWFMNCCADFFTSATGPAGGLLRAMLEMAKRGLIDTNAELARVQRNMDRVKGFPLVATATAEHLKDMLEESEKKPEAHTHADQKDDSSGEVPSGS